MNDRNRRPRLARSNAPVKKVERGAEAGALTILLVFVVGQLGTDVPAEVASAFTVLVSAVIAWITPETRL